MSNYFPSKAIRQQEVVWLQSVRRALSQVFTMLIVVCACVFADSGALATESAKYRQVVVARDIFSCGPSEQSVHASQALLPIF